jgi:hypothetical protein
MTGDLGNCRVAAHLWRFGKPKGTSGDTECGTWFPLPIHTFYSQYYLADEGGCVVNGFISMKIVSSPLTHKFCCPLNTQGKFFETLLILSRIN